MTTPPSIYDIECTDIKGNPLPLRQFAGLPLLIVNTASLCGFTYQLGDIEALWQANQTKGLIVIGVPSNDFGQQEPGDNAKIASLCAGKFGVTFPLLSKTSVKGAEAHPLFKQLSEEAGPLGKPRWNFYKYIVGRDGHLQNWFTPLTGLAQPRFERAIKKAVGA